MDIKIRGIQKSFGDFTALDGIDLDIASGELIALLGPSGSGKTTLLRSIAGLEFPDSGRILFGEGEAPRIASAARGGDERPSRDGRAALDREVSPHQGRHHDSMIDVAALPIRERRVGFVFQHYALFKHMTVLDNVAFGLRVRKRAERPPEALIRERSRELIALVQLDGLEKRYPSQLSGGQRQRVALARALAIEPRVLLLDEPFGALDAKVRKDLRRWLRQLQKQTGYTTIFVTHDQEEALELADRVVVMNRGRIEQVDTTDAIYEKPATPFVFGFLGNTNVLPGEVRGRELFIDGQDAPVVTDSIHAAGLVDIYVRPADLRLADATTPGFAATIRSTQRTGPILRCDAVSAQSGLPIEIEMPHLHHDAQALRAGQTVRLRISQFSLFARAARQPAATAHEVPTLIGHERARGRLG